MAYAFACLSQAQIDEFLQTPRHAIVATNRSDGPPQISSVWFLYEEGSIYFGISSESAKFHNLRRDARLSVCVDAGHPDARTVTIYGTTELIEDDTAWRDDMLRRITRRYAKSEEEARQFNEEAGAGSEDVLVVVTPTKTIALDYN
jgi:PPOX class probable F420-dependent enzyme